MEFPDQTYFAPWNSIENAQKIAWMHGRIIRLVNFFGRNLLMRNKNWWILSFALSALMFASLACSLVQSLLPSAGVTAPPPRPTPVPATAQPKPTAAQNTPIPTATAANTPAPASLDGTWQGKTSAGTDFEFTVKNNQVTSFNLSYVFQQGSCSGSGTLGDNVSIPIADNKINVQWSDPSGEKVSFSGSFTSATQAGGLVEFSMKSKTCGAVGSKMTWSVLSADAIAAGQTVELPPSLPATRVGYNGNWAGTNSDGNQVTFTVANDQVTSVMLNYSISSNGCSLGGAVSTAPDNAPIKNSSFSVPFKDSDGRQFTFIGKFTSPSQATGTIDIKGTADSFCGAFSAQNPWTAKYTLPDNNATPQATETPDMGLPTDTPAAAIDPTAIINGFFDAIHSGNINAALAFADDSIIFNLGTTDSSIGKDELKAYLTTLKNSGVTFTVSNPQNFGDSMVSFSAKSSAGKTFASSSAMLSDGKIVILTLK